MREHPAREVIGLPDRQTEAGGKRPALRPDITEHGRVRQIDRERGVRTAQPLVELAHGRGDPGPVKAGVGISARLPVYKRLDRRQRQVARVERDPVAAQHRLRVRVSRAPCVAVVRVDGLVARQPDQRPRAEVLERSSPVREAALQLARRVGASRLNDQPVALCERAVEMSAPGGQAQLPPGVCGRGRRRGAGGVVEIGHRDSFSEVRTKAVGPSCAHGLECGSVARRGFSGWVRALSGGCAGWRSARRGRASARAEQVLTSLAAVGIAGAQHEVARAVLSERARDGSIGARSGGALFLFLRSLDRLLQANFVWVSGGTNGARLGRTSRKDAIRNEDATSARLRAPPVGSGA